MGGVRRRFRRAWRRRCPAAPSNPVSCSRPCGSCRPARREPDTVAAAYRTLRERGVIETDGRRGSRVRARPATTGREYIRVEVPEGVRDVAAGNP
ncbi:hypothetical protein SGLAM104S_10443 [Streptomyces glaucescens]